MQCATDGNIVNVMSWHVFVRTILAIATHGTVYEPRVYVIQRAVVNAQAVGSLQVAESLYHHVSCLHEPIDDLASLFILEVQRNAFLVAVKGSVGGAH